MKNPYYQKENFTLYKEDSLKLLEEFAKNQMEFDMIFADPPYNLSNGGFTCQAGRMVSVDKGKWDQSKGVEVDFEFHRQWINTCRKVLKPNGTIWISGTYHSIYQCGFALQMAGYHILNDISWFKPNASPNLSCRFFTASHETLIWARKDKKGKHTFDYNLMKNGKWPEDPVKKPGLQMRSVWGVEEGVVWTITTPKPEEKKYGKHPTQKPLELLRRIILASTKPGDLILDPFAGSSTTGIAAYKEGRRFVGIDTEEQYLEISKKRFEDLAKHMEARKDRKNRRIDNNKIQIGNKGILIPA